ncbi:S8 family peptidase [Haloprofundus salinisoli]|uniref:S8 family peptidase n=1 Tax=Haloprofundus salinisoli TaxID=2876193 RepID=UPI001CCD3E84|nr:S8 family peptidase [Haloprofundus salinisoli]
MSRQSAATRRGVLRAVGGGATTGLAAGSVREGDGNAGDTVEVNVGLDATAEGAGFDVVRRAATRVVRPFAFDALTVELPREAVATLRRRPEIRYVEVNGTMRTYQQSTSQAVPHGISRIGAQLASEAGITGDGVDVAIVDSGVDSDHPDLRGNLGEGRAFVNCRGRPRLCRVTGNGNACKTDWDDDDNHGTHCAGVVGAVDNDEGVVGVAPETTLHAVKVIYCAGVGLVSDIAAGIEHVADRGWAVASLSFGSQRPTNLIRDACRYAAEEGVLLVAAAGNGRARPNTVGFPATLPTVLAVSAVDRNGEFAAFSSTGPRIDIAAPGTNVRSTVPGGYRTYSGTSMACPHVAGAAALLVSTGLSTTEARERLVGTADDLGLGRAKQGAGLLNVAAALGLGDDTD